jgi:hypothetical protein
MIDDVDTSRGRRRFMTGKRRFRLMRCMPLLDDSALKITTRHVTLLTEMIWGAWTLPKDKHLATLRFGAPLLLACLHMQDCRIDGSSSLLTWRNSCGRPSKLGSM